MSAGVLYQGSSEIGEVIKRKLMRLTVAIDGVRVSVVPASGVRGAEVNAMIARAQKGNRRNPFYLNREDLRLVRGTARALAKSDTVVRFNVFKAIGEYMLDAVLRNISDQRNPGGAPFKALTTTYAKFKQRKYGFTTPILKATGDLMASLRIRIDRVR